MILISVTMSKNSKASYKARFQHWADPNCADEPLVMQVFCSGDIAPVTISHASLRCKTINSGGWNGIECTTTCEESGTCEEVYLERENSENGVFAEIVFDCLGETIEEVEARAVYKGGEDGYCSQNPSSNGENFHVAQLGVSCPRDDGARSFEYDDLYFDCGFSNTARQYGNNKLTCVEGIDCAGSTCTVPFDDLTVQAEAHKFAGCIQSVSGVPVPEEPTIQPMMVPVGDYEATYEARWELSIDTTCKFFELYSSILIIFFF